MEAKLKALKVADLKAILAKADTQAPAKSTKADLIARILASEPAQDAYRSIHEPEEEPTSDYNYEVEATPVEEAPAPVPAAPAPLVAEAAPPVDPELEKRRQRAERFGIPFVEPPTKPQPKARPSKAVPVAEDAERLKARAARFGVSTEPSLKRAAPSEPAVDAEEAERRRKRAERFGTNPVVT